MSMRVYVCDDDEYDTCDEYEYESGHDDDEHGYMDEYVYECDDDEYDK